MSDNQQEFLGRIDQLDAKLLDHEFLNTLKRQVILKIVICIYLFKVLSNLSPFSQINSAFGLFSSSGILPHIHYGPEMNVLLKSGKVPFTNPQLRKLIS
jgi:hypothetical protein